MTAIEMAPWAGFAVTLAGLIMLHLRTTKSDAEVVRSGVTDEEREGSLRGRVQLESMNAILREDNTALREDKRELIVRGDKLEDENDILKMEVARLRKRYGVNGENGPPTTPPAG